MSFDLAELTRQIDRHGHVARVVVAETKGSAPREAGAAMLVWQGSHGPEQIGTIGGGELELQAAHHAFARQGATRHALGPELGQCCGGAVTLWTEQFTAADLPALQGSDVIARGPGEMPLAVHRLLDKGRAQGQRPAPGLVQGWMVEPLLIPQDQLWIWGAGHVGRALVDVLSPLPDLAITWVDTDAARFPDQIPPSVTQLWHSQPETLMRAAPHQASHLILTFSHTLDLTLCHAALCHGFGWCGLIGSDTKWARFRSRLTALGHQPDEIAQISCPIGQKTLGKHPQAIAIGVAAQLLKTEKRNRDTCRTSFLASRA
ncbi:MAG: xanthine dehydrogenase accessory protein XdhC [Pelagimonas sp.]|jgi:xanthine dehydrogenase accessory factor|nr:xanthine dehydrogenase accessory protein XdhC [Pelagimonas sp.]